MSSLKGTYYKFHNLSLAEMRDLNDFLKRHAYARLWPAEIRAHKTDPGFEDRFGFWSWRTFARLLEKHGPKVRKYGLYVFPKRIRWHSRRLGWITVRFQEFAIPDWSSDHYPSIELVNVEVHDARTNRVFGLIEEYLKLERTEKQKRNDLKERLLHSIRREDIRKVVSAGLGHDNFDLAVTGTVQLVESALRRKCTQAGHPEAEQLSGVELAKVAYHEDNGCLVPPIPVADRATHGMFLIIQGFFLYIRNAFVHNTDIVKSDTYVVLPVIQFCEFLLELIERSQPRH